MSHLLQAAGASTSQAVFCCSCLRTTSRIPPAAAASLTLVRHASSPKKGAAPPKKKVGGFSKSKKSGPADASLPEGKAESLKKFLYGDDASARKARDLERQAALAKAIPNLEAHETILRAWQLHKRKEREQFEQEMQDRYECMTEAIAELEKTDPRLFKAITQVEKFSTVRGTRGPEGQKASLEGRIPGLFPRQLPVLR